MEEREREASENGRTKRHGSGRGVHGGGRGLGPSVSALWTEGDVEKPVREVVKDVYARVVSGSVKVDALEASGYLERYVWPKYEDDEAQGDDEVTMSVVLMVNAKFSAGVNGLDGIAEDGEKFERLAMRSVEMMLRGLPALRGGGASNREKDSGKEDERVLRDVSARERVWLLRFFQHCMNSLELEPVRRFFLRTVSLSVFHCLSERRREVELQRRLAAVANGAEGMRATGEALQKHWNALVKRERKRGDDAPLENPMTTFMMRLILHFIDTLNSVVIELESMTADAREKKYGSRATSSADTGTPLSNGRHANGGGSTHAPSGAADVAGAEAFEVEVEVDAAADRPDMELYFCETFMGFMVDVLSQLPTRRFVSALVREAALVVKMDAMEMHRFPELALLGRLARMFRQYVDFPVDNETGETIDDEAIDTIRYGNALCFLKLCFKCWPQLRELSLGSVKAVADGGDNTSECLLMKSLKCLDDKELTRMCCKQLRIMPEPATNVDSNATDAIGGDFYASADFMRSVIVDHVVRGCVSSMRNTLVRMPVYPTEKLMYDANRLPAYSATGGTGPFSRGGDVTLALPKLNLQFLSLYDYLQRNFHLYRLEAAYEIRDDVNDVAKRMQPVIDYAPAGSDARFGGGGGGASNGGLNAAGGNGETVRFRGWARMALPLRHFAVTQVKRPHVGETIPSGVRAEARINLIDCGSYARHQYGRDNPIAAEWDEIRQRDVVFLITIRPLAAAAAAAHGAASTAPSTAASNAGTSSTSRNSTVVDPVDAMKAYGIVAVRGAEVVEIRDANGKPWYNTANTSGPGGNNGGAGKNGTARRPEGSQRSLILELDPMQYHLDVEDLDRRGDDAEDVYASFNVIMRRNAKENNFKAVLSAIRDIIVSTSSAEGEGVLPEWLQDVFLGYGDPGAAKAAAKSTSSFGSGLDVVARSDLTASIADGDTAAGNDDTELQYEAVDLKDTFLDEEHVRASFENRAVEMIGREKDRPVGPATRCKVYIPIEPAAPRGGGSKSKKRKAGGDAVAATGPTPEELHQRAMEAYASSPVFVEPYARGMKGPYDEAEDMAVQPGTTASVPPASAAETRDSHFGPRRNTIRFTPVQVGAVVEAMRPGLTMIVGPPGTGKTDVAVQILSLLYHQNTATDGTPSAVSGAKGKLCSTSRTLLITHSNSALNDVFEKISACDVPSRYLLRAGMGERDLNTRNDYSREGRIDYFLQRRLNLLAEVERLAQSLTAVPSSTTPAAAADAGNGSHMGADVAFTCESAANFFTMYIRPKIEAFEAKVASTSSTVGASDVGTLFPFGGFFNEDSVRAKLSGPDVAANVETARQCFEHLRVLFAELRECRPFELLTTAKDRGDYIMTTLAKVVGMTTTHAALRRADFAKMNFEFDNIVMEEAAQVLEIETFIPLTLQQSGTGMASSAAAAAASSSSTAALSTGSRLKRFILIGDHHQLPPVVQMGALAKYSHMDQSMFQRMIRLGVPHVQLNSQGRARPSIANLFNWHYKTLGDLPHVIEKTEYRMANAGFAHEFQFIDVGSGGSSGGTGESSPTPYYYQNLAEAEYIVSCYQYMRLLGYPSSSVSILTTYRGQKHLIRDVVRARCSHPAFGPPHKITTVDKYQGQQNEYILLSLVRTKHVGHLRDVRRLIVALSRARKGLYIFGKIDLFQRCPELREAISRLLRFPDKLALVANEPFPATRMLDASEKLRPYFVASPDAMHEIVAQMTSYWESLHLQQQQQQQQQQQHHQQQQQQQEEEEIHRDNDHPIETMQIDG